MIGISKLRDKIVSIKNIQKITKAMEMIAASKMYKTKERMNSSRPYAEKIKKIFNRIMSGNLKYKHNYLDTRTVKCIGYLIISTDKGLTGGLNINLFKKLLINIKQFNKKGIDVKLSIIGAQAASFFNFLKSKIITQITGIRENISIIELSNIIKIILQAYEEKQIDKLYVASNKFINTMLQIPQILQVLPLTIIEKPSIKNVYWDYLYESDYKILLNNLLYRYIESQIYQCIIENLVSEQSARMLAMKSATNNGANLIKDMNLIYNKFRQTSITQELTEIVSGASVI